MATPSPSLELVADAEQVERYEFLVRFPGAAYPPLPVDEPPPTGGDRGPNPVRVLAASVGHCMSSTLVNTLERAKVPVTSVTAAVRVQVGRNVKGRLRVLALDVAIETSPLHEEDRERFEHCVAIFQDYCTVSGAVREGIPISSRVGPRSRDAGAGGTP